MDEWSDVSNAIPAISIERPTDPSPDTDITRGDELPPRVTPPPGASLSPKKAPTPTLAEDSIIQPGSHEYQSPDPLPGILTKIKRVGGGAYGDVVQGVWTLPGKDPISVAIKCIREAHLGNEDEPEVRRERFERRIKRETVIWQKASHKNILPFYGYQIVDGEPLLVSPWCKNGSLASYINPEKHPDLTDVEKLKLVRDVASGLAYLHSLDPPIIHGDIKPDNVVVTDDIVACLCDFGISRVMTSLGTHTGLTTTGQSAGTAQYQAKELFEEDCRPTTMSDVYAFGGLILATMSGRPPFWRVGTAAPIIIAISTNKTAKPEDHSCLPANDPLWRLLARCWNPTPEKRPTMAEVLEELEAEIKRRSG